MTTPPLQWSIDVHSVHSPVSFSFEASEEELEAIKRYAGVQNVTSFKSELKTVPLSAGKFRVAGQLRADAVQASVVDLDDVPASIDESFSVEFWPENLIGGADGKALSYEEDAPEPIIGGRIPIGEFLCELFLVSLDPYPRNENDAFEWHPPESEPQATPFAELAHLKRQKKPDGG
jgi:hypothetical protein